MVDQRLFRLQLWFLLEILWCDVPLRILLLHEDKWILDVDGSIDALRRRRLAGRVGDSHVQ